MQGNSNYEPYPKDENENSDLEETTATEANFSDEEGTWIAYYPEVKPEDIDKEGDKDN